ncbi:hypothetical protein N665_0162s0064 [Sinapis alba]|nr:hypothetical protein N665_0162s0064 [Sinapis alba]
MSSPIRRCFLKGKAIATSSYSESIDSPLVRRPRTIMLGAMENPRTPTGDDLAELNDEEQSIVHFSMELEDREASGHSPLDEVLHKPENTKAINPGGDANLVDKDKSSAEKETEFRLADFLPMRWTGTNFEFDEEIDPHKEQHFFIKKNQKWENYFPTRSSFKGSWFNNFSLWWPLPEFLTTYCSQRKIALGQYTTKRIRIMVTLTVLAAELGIKMSVQFFEELTTPSITAETWFFYGKMVPKYNVITRKPSKVNFWNRSYFYMKINKASFEDPSVILNGYFNANIDLLGKWAQGGSDSFQEQVEAIRTLKHQHWPYISGARIQAALNRITRADTAAETPSRTRTQRMGKLNLASLLSYADLIGTPSHRQEESSDGGRPAKRRRASHPDEGALNVSPRRSPLPEVLVEEHHSDEVGSREPSPERSPPL